MALKSAIEFIDAALFCSSSFALSYTDPDQKLLIRKHLLSLLQDYPTFRLSIDTFTHNDGTIVKLLNANGCLHISSSTPPIPLTIWLHENYPSMPPIVIVSSDSMSPIRLDHPFVDPSGVTTPSYLKTWQYPGRNLSHLLHKLVKLFTHDHPFFCSISSSSFTHPSLVSKTEALDRLESMIHYDMVALKTRAMEEIEQLMKIQAEMGKRVGITERILDELKKERAKLKDVGMVLADDADVLINWVRANDPTKSMAAAMEGNEVEDAYEGVDDENNMVLDCLAASKAIDDLIYVLDKAIEQGLVSFETYIKQVRILAREQFLDRAMAVKLRGPKILNLPY